MKHIITVVAMLFATSAFAVGIGNDNPPGGAQGQLQGQAQGQMQGQAQGQAQLTNVSVSNRITADSRSAAAAFATGGLGGAGGAGGVGVGGAGGSATGGLATTGNSTSSVSFEYPNQVAGLVLGSLYPSAPCMGTSQLGGGNGFFNFGVGSSWESTECQIRETARSFSGMGMKEDALAVLCASSYAQVAPSCAAYAKPKQEQRPEPFQP